MNVQECDATEAEWIDKLLVHKKIALKHGCRSVQEAADCLLPTATST
jgi:hypothetical protein